MKKQEARQLFTQKRNQLTVDECAVLNLALLQQFKLISFTRLTCISIFLPITAQNEPDTWQLINWLKAQHPEIKQAYPKADFTDSSMQHFLADDTLQIAVNRVGIPEPISGNLVEPMAIDLVIVPLLAVDRRGYRVGYGKGFYDRFMAQCKPGTPFIGLSFFEPVDEIADVNQQDIPLNQCIGPGETYRF